MAPTVTKAGNSNGPLDNTYFSIDAGKKQGNGSTAWSKGSGKQEKGGTHSGIRVTELGNKSEQGFKKQQQLDRINRYWFLLDHDLVEAINKGNHALLHMAASRVEFLIGVVSKELLEQGVKGEEEALWSIHEFLYNNGWWEKASNLGIDWNEEKGVEETMDPILHFLRAYEHLIHPNSRVEALQGKREAVRMALNQIHYGSIELARMESKKRPSEHYVSAEQSTKGKGDLDTRKKFLQHLQVAKNFIKMFQHLVEPSVLKDAILGNDKAISLALGQIHHKTLPTKADGSMSQTYKEALLTPPKEATPKKIFSPKSRVDRNAIKGKISIFFTGFEASTHARELWQMFKKEGAIKDIILPRRKDKFGNKFGFVIVANFQEAERVIKALNGRQNGEAKLYLALAKNSRLRTQQRGSPINSANTKTSGGGIKPIHTSLPKNESSKKETIPKGAKKIGNPSAVQDQFISTSSNQGTKKESMEPVKLDLHEPLHVELSSCVLLTTAKRETTENVNMIVRGLGFKGVIIRGMSTTMFLAYFPGISSLDEIDLEFLELGFLEVRAAKEVDLIPPRQAWVEIRGLPIQGWTEANYRQIIKPWGEIIHFGRTIDEDEFYVTPKVLIDTTQIENINAKTTVSLLGKNWKVALIESWGIGEQLNEAPTSQTGYMTDEVYEVGAAMEGGSMGERVSESKNELEEEGEVSSCINPATPRYDHNDIPVAEEEEVQNKERIIVDAHLTQEQALPLQRGPQIQTRGESPEVTVLHTSNWIPREVESSISLPKRNSESELSEVNDDLYANHPQNSDILKELENLKVQVKRGRPRKYNRNQLNKHFKLPRRRKLRGEGLKQTTHFFLNANYDEAEAIFETGTLMGLLPLSSKENSVKFIQESLK